MPGIPWVFIVKEIKTLGVGTYVLVHIWRSKGAEARGDSPNIINEHLMNLKSIRQRNITRLDGYTLRQSGVWASPRAPPNPLDPPVKENVNINIRAEIEENIKLFIDSAIHTNLPNIDLSEPRWIPDTSDPRGILARVDVQELKNKIIEHIPKEIGRKR